VAAAMEMEQLTNDNNLKKAFGLFDKDNSGLISADEIREVLGLTDNADMNSKINEIIDQVDENGDGEISLEEFKFMMQKIAE
jgi:calcium-dependent protein kinase